MKFANGKLVDYRRRFIAAGVALGIGMGGFIDGIVLHQLLQIHNMLSAKYPTRGEPTERLVENLQINMFWDGLFHGLTWVMTAVGIAMLWQAVKVARTPMRGSTLIGAMIFGWGLFNLVEGIINHHILHIHHVTETANHLTWDIAFLASGVIMMLIGWMMIDRSPFDSLPENSS